MKETKAIRTQTGKTTLLETGIQRNYKDTVFRMIFREKENLLSLYNALNNTAYVETDSLEITTLENADCIRNNILTDFLTKNRAEAIAVSIFEYDEEKHMKSERKECGEAAIPEIFSDKQLI